MEKFLEALLTKLDAQSIFTLIVLYGVWKLTSRFVDKFGQHGDELVGVLKSIQADVHSLTRDVAVIASRVDIHERRIEKIEGKIGD